MKDMKEIFGILAITLGISAAVPYIFGILKKSVQPHRISWAIWSFISLVTLTSYVSSGAHWSALLAVAAALNNFVIFFLALKFGTGGASIQDRIALGIAIVGIVLWILTRQAAFGLVFALCADFVGLVLTLKKAHKDPASESALAWAMAVIASSFGLLAVHKYNFTQTIYPVYAIASGLCLFLVSMIGRKAK
jgi:hypothetical protein